MRLNLGADTAGQWVVNMRSAAVLLSTMHAGRSDELAQELLDMAEAIEGQ